MTRFISRHVLLVLALALPVLVLGSGGRAAAVSIDFEAVPDLIAMPLFFDGQFVQDQPNARLSIQLRDSHGVSFTSPAGYVALVRLGGGHATSGVNGIGGVNAANALNYDSPIGIRFTLAGDPAITDFVSIKGDLQGGVGTVTMKAFDVNNTLVGIVTAPNTGGVELSLSAANIHYVEITQESGAFIAFDDLQFNPLTSYLGQAPVARVTPVGAIHGVQTVTLDGSPSDDDDTATDRLLFAWTLTTKPNGSSAILSAANTMTPSFTADVLGDYTVELTVTDARGLRSAPARVTISSSNAAPVAEAGDDKGAFAGAQVSLNGSASTDPDGDGLGFSWTLTKPEGSAAALTGQLTATPAFTADVPGTYVATLTVIDPFGASATDTVTVSVVRSGNYPQEQLVRALNALSRMTPAEVTTRGNQNAMQQHLGQVIAWLQAGDVAQAADKLLKVIDRTDGCARWGAPDGDGEGRDWIVTCIAQARVYPRLMSALEALVR